MAEEIRVGVGPRDYNSKRAFQGARIEGVRFLREPFLPLRRISRYVPPLRTRASSVIRFLSTGRADLYHTFNLIVANRKPWVVSFESLLPRVWMVPEFRARLFSVLARDECRRILALSENARTHLERRNRENPLLGQVLEKVRVVYPALEEDSRFEQVRSGREPSDEAHLVFVGNEFFRKGGQIAVRAWERLRNDFPVRLTVVSRLLEQGNLLPQGDDRAEVWRERMEACGVRHLEGLTFGEVRELLSGADALLLPTMDDSFGYSVLEAMSMGVPTVATRIRALPEIVSHRETGLLVDVPVTVEGRLEVSEESLKQIEDGLVEQLSWLLEDPERGRAMGNRSREEFLRRFTMDRLAADLGEVYREAL